MAINVMNLVWETDLTSSEKLVLLALADHASPDGTDIFPGTARMVRKTGFSERGVYKIRRRLINRGVLVVAEVATWEEPTHYRIDLHVLTQLGTREERSSPPAPDSTPGVSSSTPLNPIPNPPEPSAPKPPIEPPVEPPPVGVEQIDMRIEEEAEKIYRNAINSGKTIGNVTGYKNSIKKNIRPEIEKATHAEAAVRAGQGEIDACWRCNADGIVAWSNADQRVGSERCTHDPADYQGFDLITATQTE